MFIERKLSDDKELKNSKVSNVLENDCREKSRKNSYFLEYYFIHNIIDEIVNNALNHENKKENVYIYNIEQFI